MKVVPFIRELWRSARRPAVLRRCALIALLVGTVLTLVNQGGALWSGSVDTGIGWRVAANYLVPFLVSNLGAMPGGSRSGSTSTTHS